MVGRFAVKSAGTDPYIASTGTGAAGSTEYVEIVDVIIRAISSPDWIRSGGRLSAAFAGQRNKERALTALETAVRADTRPAEQIVNLVPGAVLGKRHHTLPYPSKMKRRQLRLPSATFAQSGVFPKPYDSLVGCGQSRTTIDGSLPASTSLVAMEATSTIESYYGR